MNVLRNPIRPEIKSFNSLLNLLEKSHYKIQLSTQQKMCADVAAHRAGHTLNGVIMKDIEFAPGIWLYCDVSNGKKARPLVPKPNRDLIIRWFHEIAHPGPVEDHPQPYDD